MGGVLGWQLLGRFVFSEMWLFDFGLHEELVDLAKRFVVITAEYDVRKPKLHLFLEMTRRAEDIGNPWYYHCFYDEALNKVLKATLRNVSQSNF